LTERRLSLGRRAEAICRRRLWWAGWKILDSNWRTSFGELDLVAVERRTLVFVEVKSLCRSEAGCRGPERPVLAVDRGKQRRLIRLAEVWLASDRCTVRVPERVTEVRFDVVGIVFDRNGSVESWEHLRDAFGADGTPWS
jgi:putative endonuclease